MMPSKNSRTYSKNFEAPQTANKRSKVADQPARVRSNGTRDRRIRPKVSIPVDTNRNVFMKQLLIDAACVKDLMGWKSSAEAAIAAEATELDEEAPTFFIWLEAENESRRKLDEEAAAFFAKLEAENERRALELAIACFV